MIPNDQPARRQMIERMLNYIIRNTMDENTLSKWEEDFVNSINEQFLSKGDLSNKQCDFLERIYDK